MKKVLFILSIALLFIMCDGGKEKKETTTKETQSLCKIQEKNAGGSLKEFRFEGIGLREDATSDSIWMIHFDVPGIEKYSSDLSESLVIVVLDTTMNTKEELLAAIEKRGGICQ